VLYHLGHACLFHSGDRVLLFGQVYLDCNPPISLPAIAVMIGVPPCPAFFLLRWAFMDYFCLGRPGTVILYISAFHVAGVIGAPHCTQLLVEMRLGELFVWVGLEL
jgi:hypothetical protein